jgi:ribonuclease HII
MIMAKYIIGIDEVGRGPLAGPIVVCALALKACWKRSKHLPPLRDSKKLTVAQREQWYNWIKKHTRIKFALARVYSRGIERLNISQAANKAATRAFEKLIGIGSTDSPDNYSLSLSKGNLKIFLDGGLYLNSLKAISYKLIPKTIIKGDEKINAIKLASIVAKVTRDRFMDKLHKKYPVYGFDRHKGYATRIHIAALKKFGPSIVHRATFLKNL